MRCQVSGKLLEVRGAGGLEVAIQQQQLDCWCCNLKLPVLNHLCTFWTGVAASHSATDEIEDVLGDSVGLFEMAKQGRDAPRACDLGAKQPRRPSGCRLRSGPRVGRSVRRGDGRIGSCSRAFRR